MEHADLSALGKPATAFAGFDTFPVPREVHRVEFRSGELTARCPVTDQPDFYDVVVAIGTNGRTIEAKTFKLYLQSFRDRAVTCEVLAADIAVDVRDAVTAFWCTVELTQHVRGGVSLTAHASAYGNDDDEEDGDDDDEGDEGDEGDDVPWA